MRAGRLHEQARLPVVGAQQLLELVDGHRAGLDAQGERTGGEGLRENGSPSRPKA
jgi:hypothetical protein